MSDENKRKEKLAAIEAAKLQIEKQFGKGALMQLGDGKIQQMEVIHSGSILLDEALGVGGYPRGRVIEIYGPESSGKTTLALHAVAEAQREGGIAAFIDAEHALDAGYAKNLGVDVKSLWVSQPDNGEQALEIADSLIRSQGVDVIVIDSVAALTPQAEIRGDMGDAQMGLQARLMSQALRKLTASISKSGTTLIFINQIRMKIGVMFGNPETTTGGNALKFYASIRLEVRRIETMMQGSDNAIGNRVRVKVVKNKVAPPFKKVELEIIFGKGISRVGSLLEAAIRHEFIQKSGSWYALGDTKIGQGREAAKSYLEANPEIYERITQQVREKVRRVDGDEEEDSAEEPAVAQKAAAAPVAAAAPSAVDAVAQKAAAAVAQQAPAAAVADVGEEIPE